MKITLVIPCLLSLSTAFAQLVEIPISHYAPTGQATHPGARIQSTPLTLPFWDDFSYTDTLSYPQEDLWLYGKSVLINSGTGIQPPTKNVATFDGADSVGKPYNVNDRLAKGPADKLVSQPIRMDLVDPALRTTVYFSFFFQIQGRGESPDPGDQLVVSFKNNSGTWEPVYTRENDETLLPDTFYQVLIQITDDKYYHGDFQFRIQNFARLSGPYDSWNVDYIFLNAYRSATDTSYPDRSISSSLSYLFNDYHALPYKHFKENVPSMLRQPTIELYNLRAGNIQPFDYNTTATLKTFKGTAVTTSNLTLDVAQDPGALLTGLQYLTITLNQVPPVAAYDVTADSVNITFNYQMSTKDNVLPPPIDNGDYDPVKYSPIDFRVNDKIAARYRLSTYYAYDDGKAEYGAGISQAGSYMAFKYPLKYSQPDTLLAVDIYFPQFSDNSSQSLLLQVRTDLSDNASSILHQQSIVVNRTTQNKFTRYKLNRFVVVQGTVYIAWKQLLTASNPVGLDKNNDNADKIYYNTNGTWVQNTNVHGSIMVRPVFGYGTGDGVITGVEEPNGGRIYPNPSGRLCYLPSGAEQISVMDLTGRTIEAEVNDSGERKSLSFVSPFTGIAIVRYFLGNQLRTEKIMVRVE